MSPAASSRAHAAPQASGAETRDVDPVRRLYWAVIHHATDRDALWAGIDRRFAASVPRANSVAAQAMADLDALARTKVLTTGEVPFLKYLDNLEATAGHIESVRQAVAGVRAMMLTSIPASAHNKPKPTRNDIIGALARLPLAGTFSGRSAIAQRYERSLSRTEHASKRVDLGKIVDQIHQLDGDKGWQHLLIDAAATARGTSVARALDDLFDRLD